jgi:hypothetical protein
MAEIQRGKNVDASDMVHVRMLRSRSPLALERSKCVWWVLF